MSYQTLEAMEQIHVCYFPSNIWNICVHTNLRNFLFKGLGWAIEDAAFWKPCFIQFRNKKFPSYIWGMLWFKLFQKELFMQMFMHMQGPTISEDMNWWEVSTFIFQMSVNCSSLIYFTGTEKKLIYNTKKSISVNFKCRE